MNHSPWLWISKAAQDRAIAAAGPTGLAILAGLARLESNSKIAVKDGFYASAVNIAGASGVGARSVQRYLPLLAQAGLFVMKPGRTKATGAFKANQFRLLNVGPADRQIGGSPTATESGFNGGHKRKFSRREKELSSEGKESGLPAAPSGSAGGDSNPPKAVATSKEGWIR
jgi:hypothetical protein